MFHAFFFFPAAIFKHSSIFPVVPNHCWYQSTKYECGLSLSCVFAGAKVREPVKKILFFAGAKVGFTKTTFLFLDICKMTFQISGSGPLQRGDDLVLLCPAWPCCRSGKRFIFSMLSFSFDIQRWFFLSNSSQSLCLLKLICDLPRITDYKWFSDIILQSSLFLIWLPWHDFDSFITPPLLLFLEVFAKC